MLHSTQVLYKTVLTLNVKELLVSLRPACAITGSSNVLVPLHTYTKTSASPQVFFTRSSTSASVLRPGLTKE